MLYAIFNISHTKFVESQKVENPKPKSMFQLLYKRIKMMKFQKAGKNMFLEICLNFCCLLHQKLHEYKRNSSIEDLCL